MASEVVARHEPDDLGSAADHDLGGEWQPASELGTHVGAAHRSPDHEGPGGADVDGVQTGQLPGEQ